MFPKMTAYGHKDDIFLQKESGWKPDVVLKGIEIYTCMYTDI